VQRFVPDYASIVNSINLLLKKEKNFEWKTYTQEDFNNIKREITTNLVLISPYFQMDFIIYSIFKDSYATIRKCVSCHHFSRKMKKYVMSLQPIIVEQPFSQWGLDVFGPINQK
jgi:hypothetical protein